MRTATIKKATPNTIKPAAKLPKAIAKSKQSIATAAKPKVSNINKQSQILTLLSRPKGVNMKELMQATGWQAHCVRGFLSGTIKKKLGHHLISQKQDGVQIYRIGNDSQ